MTPVLKREGADAHAVRPLDFQASKTESPGPVEHSPIAALREEVADLQKALEEAAQSRSTELEAAREAGRRLAEAEFRRDEAEALATLKAGVEKALAGLDQHFSESEKLALALALTALERVVGEPNQYRALISECVRTQITGLRRDTVKSVSVSVADFPHPMVLDELSAQLGLNHADVMADELLPAGDCRIELRLGAVHISVSNYWAELQALCRRLLQSERPT